MWRSAAKKWKPTCAITVLAFELEAINSDRHGVRDSIIGRMQRHGGSATIRAREPGTEVCLRLALQ